MDQPGGDRGNKRLKLLLINPEFPDSFWSFSFLTDNVGGKSGLYAPLGLATVAALTPASWDVTIVDENVEPIDWDAEADVVGVGGMAVQVERQKEILRRFRQQGRYVVAGGSWASLCPDDLADHADTVISGEAEYIWPQFCSDFEAGRAGATYQATTEVDPVDSPLPRYDLLNLDRYLAAGVQFSRGCPYTCEFCDIIVMFGRKPRTKSLTQIGKELDALREQGVTNVTFVDDNLIGHLPKCKELLAFLCEYQARHGYPFSFGTEASINLAEHPELVSRFRDANFAWVFIGIESPSREALLETKKNQNTRRDLLDQIHTIYQHGLDVQAGFIVGFDADDEGIFEEQYRFVVAAGITIAMVGLLQAMPKTPLYLRLDAAGRLLHPSASRGERVLTNVVPLRMSYDELVNGYSALWQRLMSDQSVYQKIKNKYRHLREPRLALTVNMAQSLAYGRRLVAGILRGGPRRWRYFLLSVLVARNTRQFKAVLMDWVFAMAMKDTLLGGVLQQDPGSVFMPGQVAGLQATTPQSES